jgi:hypothetical protein
MKLTEEKMLTFVAVKFLITNSVIQHSYWFVYVYMVSAVLPGSLCTVSELMNWNKWINFVSGYRNTLQIPVCLLKSIFVSLCDTTHRFEILSHINPIHTISSYISKIHLNIVHAPTFWSSEWSLFFWLSHNRHVMFNVDESTNCRNAFLFLT